MATMHRIIVNICLNRAARRASKFAEYDTVDFLIQMGVSLAECKALLA